MSIDEKVAVMRDVAEAVHAAHGLGLVHRDLKPANIMVEARPDGGWHPCVMDFGLARESTMDTMTTDRHDHRHAAVHVAGAGARRARAVDRRTDVYSLGATLYELLTRPAAVRRHESLAIALIAGRPATSRRRRAPRCRRVPRRSRDDRAQVPGEGPGAALRLGARARRGSARAISTASRSRRGGRRSSIAG